MLVKLLRKIVSGICSGQRLNRKKEKESEIMAFAENLKAFREGKSLSQAELAKMANISQPTVAQYEKGMKVPTIIVGVDLARALNATVEELVNGKKE